MAKKDPSTPAKRYESKVNHFVDGRVVLVVPHHAPAGAGRPRREKQMVVKRDFRTKAQLEALIERMTEEDWAELAAMDDTEPEVA